MKLIEITTIEYIVPDNIKLEFETSTYDQNKEGLMEFLSNEGYIDELNVIQLDEKFELVND